MFPVPPFPEIHELDLKVGGDDISMAV